MSFSRRESEKLETILKRAYREKEKIPVDGRWRDSLLPRIRELGQVQSPPFLTVFERLVWQLAPVNSLLILLFVVLLIALDLASGIDVFQALMNGKEEISLSQMFGV